MLKNTFIARASDGLILCETYDNVTDQQSNRKLTYQLYYSRETQAQCKEPHEAPRVEHYGRKCDS